MAGEKFLKLTTSEPCESKRLNQSPHSTVVAARQQVNSKALPVGDGLAKSIVLALRDPHLQECAEGKQDRSSNRCRVLSLWRSNHLDLHRGWSQRRQFFRHALNNPLEHVRAT